MNSKFKTTDSSLFINNNAEQLPDWIKDIQFDIPEKKSLELEFDNKGAFADSLSVYRDDKDGSSREIAANYTNGKLVTDAKIKLASFLAGKYYKTEVSANSNSVNLNVIIDGVPANFKFIYALNDNKLKNNDVFYVNCSDEDAEYPFSKAGLDECLADIKSNKIKTSQKVESVGKYSIINREEIIRRYNGKLRDATDKINELLSEGSLVGVGSNSYASVYDIDYLFPQMEKEAMPEKLPEFEFVPNEEHVATNEHKSAKLLSIEASKLISQFFQDYVIRTNARYENELLTEADVLSDSGIRHKAHFCFGIENEKLASLKFVESNDERMTVEQFLSKLNINNSVVDAYLANNKTASKRIYRGIVLSYKTISQKLSNIIKHENIDKIIDNWVERELIVPVNTTTYTTEKTFEELLSSINAKTLTEDEITQINELSNKAALYETEREDVKDTGVRQTEELITDDTLLNSANNYLSKMFKDFEIAGFNVDEEVINYSVKLFDEDTGLSTVVNIGMTHEGNKITNCKFTKTCETNESLKKYLLANPGKRTNAPMILTAENLKRKLSTFAKASLDEIDEVINDWCEKGKVSKLGSNTYASKYTFEQLVSMSNIKPLSDEEIISRIEKSKLNKDLKLTSAYIKDNDTRKMVDNWSSERMMLYAKSKLGQVFKDFDILDAKIDNNCYEISARAVNPSTGIRQKFSCKFEMIDGKPTQLNTVDCNDSSSIEVNAFLQHNDVTRVSHKNLVSKTSFKTKLASVIDVNNVDSIIDSLVDNQILTPINSVTFASTYSMSEIVAHLAKFGQTDIKTAAINQEFALKNDMAIKIADKRVMDNDSRKIEAAEKTLSPKMIDVKNKIEVTAKEAFNKKIITSKKLAQLNEMLSTAKEEKDLDTVWKELKKYFI